ncbi:MAG: ATP phosphoribosyltransferase, partial [Firmicutes bacterium]|nr:ATP phosphoribosyltransferase [Bacillota bacterium]
TGSVFRPFREHQGKTRELCQSGIELINVPGAKGEFEVLSMALKSLLAAGISDFRIHIGQVDVFRGLLEETGLSEAERTVLQEYIVDGNFVAAREFIKERELPENTRELLESLHELSGGEEVIKKAQKLLCSEKSRKGLDNLKELYAMLKAAGVEQYFRVDLGLWSSLNYYTGIILRGFAYGSGESIVDGGRYDKLIGSYGADKPAVGFSLRVDGILKAQNAPADEYITFALAKGRIADDAVDLLEKLGVDVSEIKSDTRKLIFTDENKKYRFFLAKAGDVPTYVENGAADIGVVGKDTLMEDDKSLYEVLDLGFGKCRLAVAGYPAAKELLRSRHELRVATKYPHIVEQFFNSRAHQTAEIIKLNGSVELAPVSGLGDVIVDIVETGSTLAANGLGVLEELCSLSARLVVNNVSMKLKHERVTEMLKSLEELLGRGK